MPTPGQELSSIDFESMIGGPLTAVVQAQAQSAMTTVDFIKAVGFKQSGGEVEPGEDSGVGSPIYITFEYPKEVAPYQPAVEAKEAVEKDGVVIEPAVEAKNAVPARYETHVIRVPALAVMPIPFIRIEETTIDFNAKINSVQHQKTDSSFSIGGELDVKHKWFGGSVKLKVTSSYKKNTERGSEVNRTYSLAVHVRAVQAEMPAGMERILGILENAISSQPKDAVKDGWETDAA